MNATPITRTRREADAVRPRRPFLLGYDPLLLLATFGLMAFSLIALKAATKSDIPGDPNYYVKRQAIFFVVGTVVMLGLARFDYSRLRELKHGIYALLCGSILIVTMIAGATRGARSWVDIGFVRVQPSEVGKALLIVCLAAYLVDRARRLEERQTTTRIVLLGLLPATLVVVQPDLGTALVYVVGTAAALFIAGTPWRHFAGLFALFATAVAIVLAGAPALGVEVLKPYQIDRLTSFLEPSEDPGDEGYQQQQSKTAIGAGEKTGRGVDGATQTRLNFLPEHHTDFVFAVVGEVYGFVGAALVLSLFALLIWRGLRILTMAKNLFGAIIAGGIVAMLLYQLFINVGMSVGIMPITGVPLPLMSYGGASVVATCLFLGLLQSIHVQARATSLAKSRVLTR